MARVRRTARFYRDPGFNSKPMSWREDDRLEKVDRRVDDETKRRAAAARRKRCSAVAQRALESAGGRLSDAERFEAFKKCLEVGVVVKHSRHGKGFVLTVSGDLLRIEFKDRTRVLSVKEAFKAKSIVVLD